METTTLPASHLQASLYHKYAQDKKNTNINLAFGFRVKQLDFTRLECALNHIIARHENLRSNFIDEQGVIWQKIVSSRTISIEPFTSDDVCTFIRPFQLETDALIRVAVKGDIVLFDFCHIIVDGFSMAIFFRELDAFYSGLSVNYSPPTAKECLVADTILSVNEAHWLTLLEKPFVPLFLPADFTRRKKYGGTGGSILGSLGKKTTETVRHICRRVAITPFIFYLTAWLVFLAKKSQADDILTGTNFSCRNKSNLRSIGFYTTIVPVRFSVPEKISRAKKNALPHEQIDSLLLRVNAHIKQSLRHQYVNMDSLLAKKHFDDYRDIFSTVFTYEHEKMADIRLNGKPCAFVPIPTKDSAFDCNLCFFPFKNESKLLFIYRADIFTQKTAARYLDEYANIIEEICHS